jgi:hypothetical protein
MSEILSFSRRDREFLNSARIAVGPTGAEAVAAEGAEDSGYVRRRELHAAMEMVRAESRRAAHWKRVAFGWCTFSIVVTAVMILLVIGIVLGELHL